MCITCKWLRILLHLTEGLPCLHCFKHLSPVLPLLITTSSRSRASPVDAGLLLLWRTALTEMSALQTSVTSLQHQTYCE